MDRSQRQEARIALAMLPTGIALTIGSFVAAVAFAVLALLGPFLGQGWPLVAWHAGAALVGLRNTVVGIEVMSAFDWRPLPLALALWLATVVAWPGWW
ncbi:hypothetical protein [Sphingomonas metalli]|nr:hypothetical protein [Sphingomonas metalli]